MKNLWKTWNHVPIKLDETEQESIVSDRDEDTSRLIQSTKALLKLVKPLFQSGRIVVVDRNFLSVECKERLFIKFLSSLML
jgi:hypothetical protein